MQPKRLQESLLHNFKKICRNAVKSADNHNDMKKTDQFQAVIGENQGQETIC
jgi:hypothetical protein